MKISGTLFCWREWNEGMNLVWGNPRCLGECCPPRIRYLRNNHLGELALEIAQTFLYWTSSVGMTLSSCDRLSFLYLWKTFCQILHRVDVSLWRRYFRSPGSHMRFIFIGAFIKAKNSSKSFGGQSERFTLGLVLWTFTKSKGNKSTISSSIYCRFAR